MQNNLTGIQVEPITDKKLFISNILNKRVTHTIGTQGKEKPISNDESLSLGLMLFATEVYSILAASSEEKFRITYDDYCDDLVDIIIMLINAKKVWYAKSTISSIRSLTESIKEECLSKAVFDGNKDLKVKYERAHFIRRGITRRVSQRLRNPHKIDDETIFQILGKEFVSKNTELNKQQPNFNTVKLDWKGSKNQLYSVLRQLKKKELLGNSYNELADFLIQNVKGFSETKKETVEKELKKDKELPRPRRINIDENEE